MGGRGFAWLANVGQIPLCDCPTSADRHYPSAGWADNILIKDTSIISLISIQELTFVGSEIANSSGLIFEIWLIVGAAYLVLCLTLSMLFKQVEKRSLRHLSR